MTYQIVELAHPDGMRGQGSIETAFEAIDRIGGQWADRYPGSAGLGDDARTTMADHRPAPHHETVYLLALRGGPRDLPTGPHGIPIIGRDDPLTSEDVLGWAYTDWSWVTNPKVSGHMQVYVDMAHQRQGIGSALHDMLVKLAIAEGRTILEPWNFAHRSTDPSDIPVDGVEAWIHRDEGSTFLTNRGYKVALIELTNVQEVSREALDKARTTPVPTPEGYRIISWRGPIPDAYLSDVTDFATVGTADIPMGSLSMDHEDWDPKVIAERNRFQLESRDCITVMAIAPDGSPAGFTHMLYPPSGGEEVHLFLTVVMREDRGKGVGTAIKHEALARIAEYWPQARRLTTQNAFQNARMLSINAKLGYKETCCQACWQKRV